MREPEVCRDVVVLMSEGQLCASQLTLAVGSNSLCRVLQGVGDKEYNIPKNQVYVCVWVRGRFLKEPAAERVGFPSFPTEAPPSSGTAVYQQRSLSVLVPWVFLRAYESTGRVSPYLYLLGRVDVLSWSWYPRRVRCVSCFWLRSLSSSKTQSFTGRVTILFPSRAVVR